MTGIVTSNADGNTLTDGTRTNVWDSQNRLVSCTANGVTSTYTYGADGLRRTSTVNGVTTYYVYDGTMMVREMQQNAQGVLQASATYLCGPRGPEYRRDDTQAEGTYSDSTGTHPAGKTRWYVYDGLGSVVGEVDPSGHLTSSGTFDVYGAKRAGGTGTASSRQGFVGSLGHVTDSETGLVYMRARYYDPSTGRFVSEDPGRSGLNWFIYCNDNPINNVDSNGKAWGGLGLALLELANSMGAFNDCEALKQVAELVLTCQTARELFEYAEQGAEQLGELDAKIAAGETVDARQRLSAQGQLYAAGAGYGIACTFAAEQLLMLVFMQDMEGEGSSSASSS